MSDQKLARMANDIAAFFESYPHDQAVSGIHEHIVAFWTPKMRATLGHAAAAGLTGLNPLVVEALAATPPAAPSPAEKAAAGPAEVGEIGASDAG